MQGIVKNKLCRKLNLQATLNEQTRKLYAHEKNKDVSSFYFPFLKHCM